MTPNETQFTLWAVGILLAILAFVGVLAVNQLMKMASDLGEIKVIIGKIDTKHEELEKRVNRIEEKIA